MSQYFTSVPYFIQLDEAIQLTEDANFQVDPNTQILLEPCENQTDVEFGQEISENANIQTLVINEQEGNQQILIEQPESQSVKIIDGATNKSGENDVFIYQIIYPEDVNLKRKPPVKRGRPKKGTSREQVIEESPASPPKASRTRSGRLVKLPKHIEKDFKKIVISNDEDEIQTKNFQKPAIEEEIIDKPEFIELPLKKKRMLNSQYKCPKCLKAYLGRNKMMQHIMKHPDHGPLSDELQKINLNLWNYLVDITNKSKPGRRGYVFCEELTNLLHNVQLLKNALFRSPGDTKNVSIDKVLGNAVGLAPGKYKFDENQLIKDVTVFKLCTNMDIFTVNKKIEEKEEEEKQFGLGLNGDNCDKIDKTDEIYPISDLLPDSVDELMLTDVVGSGGILDNSVSSDEVMNVDQFVNERFTKITQPDLECNGSSLNLDLPTLDLFQFNTN